MFLSTAYQESLRDNLGGVSAIDQIETCTFRNPKLDVSAKNCHISFSPLIVASLYIVFKGLKRKATHQQKSGDEYISFKLMKSLVNTAHL